MSIVNDTLKYLKQQKKNAEEGKINCIPSPFEGFKNEFVGIERGTYYIVSGAQKSGKTKLASYIFLYNSILYAYRTNNVNLRIFYIPLEEKPQKITIRFMVYLLYELSNRQLRIGIKEMESVYNNTPLGNDILEMLEEDSKYVDILKYYEDHVTFIETSNPTGIYKELVSYASEHGKRVMKKIPKRNQATGEMEEVDKFDHYEPDDPNEYVIILTDHVGRLSTESGMDLRQTINKYSSYMMEVRNNYNYIPVVIHQQNSEIQSLDAFKSNKIRPTPNGLEDSKGPSKDCDFMIGLSNPYAFEMKSYLGYDITKLQNHQRFFEIVLSRDGEANSVYPLFFDGKVNYFSPLPSLRDNNYEKKMEAIYKYIERIETLPKKDSAISLFLMHLINKI